MGWLDRWDRRNQKTLKVHNENEDFVKPGVVSIFSAHGLIKIAVISVVVAAAGVLTGETWGYVVAAVAIVVGGALCLDLAQDLAGWKRRRGHRRSRDT